MDEIYRDSGRLGISEIAVSLGQSHPAVSQMSRKLLAHAFVKEWADPLDERRRLLGLSPRGAQLMKRLVPIWAAVAAAAQTLDDADFKRLNLEWLEQHFRVEPVDVQVLSRPEDIVRDGGSIWLAVRATSSLAAAR